MFDGFVKRLDLLRWLGLGGQPRAVRKPDGYTRTTGPHGEIVDADTLRCCHCLAGDTKILTRSGVKDISAVEAGEEVLDNSGGMTKVLAVHRRTIPAFRRIATRGGGEPLLVSDEHPLWALRAHYVDRRWAKHAERTAGSTSDWIGGHFEVEEEPSFIPVERVERGMWLALPAPASEIVPGEFCGVPIDVDIARFIGLYLAEGCVGRDRIEFGFHKKEVEYIEFVRVLVKRLWEANCGFEDRPNSQACKLIVHSCRLEQACLLSFGRYAANKRMPFDYLFYPAEIQRALMGGLLDGDGHYLKRRGRRELGTISPHLAYQSMAVLRRLGHYPSVTSRSAFVDKNGVNHQKSYNITFSIPSPERKRWVRRHFEHAGLIWVKVTRNDRIEATLPVCNLTTESGTFAANGFATHNCSGHFEVVAGSGRERGFCRRCLGYTCGRPACMICIPAEQRLENREKGLPELAIPTAVVFGQLGTPAKTGAAVVLRPQGET